MQTFEWDNRLKLGVPEIDAQHKQWFAYTNAYLDLVHKGQGNIAILQSALKAAIAHAREHFKTEEALMRHIQYPKSEFEFHRMTHDAFVERLNALAKHGREGRTSAVEEMAAFMTGWLTKHIREVDVKYLGFYMSKTGWYPGTSRKALSPQLIRVRERIAARRKKPD